MDQETRNKLQRATQQIRRLLEAEFAEQLEGTFDILQNGQILPNPGKHLDARQRLTRQKLVDAIEHIRASGKSPKESVETYTREAAFTFLNRFVALRMLEARGLLQECVSKGDLSSGFKEFTGLAPGLSALPDGGYRLYLECLFDELSVEVKVLFDRRDTASLLWPRRAALNEVLDILGQADLAGIWREDETIGWIYQYFNSSEERKKMRDESSAPRNSRELAVRNQFFTPRYVVEFLTDNTLGRIWYEMRRGDTRLKERCKFLVRRPSEVFLTEGEAPPPETDEQEDLSQEELLKKTVYIPHRPKKDPRELKVLDPACGSGHFLLYAFDLLTVIYEEAFDDSELGPALKRDYPSREAFLNDVPRLILAHNLHGIDIDPRATQIASLALWMRAQRAYQEMKLPVRERPPVRKSNIVCAEPMPGDERMLKEFVDQLEPKVLGQLVEVVFDKMKLAGEAGSLLKIEEEIRDAVKAARKQFVSRPTGVQQSLFSELPAPARQEQFDLSGVSDAEFFDHAESLVLDNLRRYAENTEKGQQLQRRLFAEDAARGFSFIDLCRKRYDSVLMNPPFGLGLKSTEKYFQSMYTGSGNDEVAASFYSRVLELLAPSGRLGEISSRTCFYLPTLCEWRKEILFGQSTLESYVDLGEGILDGAVNETAAYVAKKEREISQYCAFGMFHRIKEKQEKLSEMARLTESPEIVIRQLTDFEILPDRPLCYWVSNTFVKELHRLRSMGEYAAEVQMGLAPRDEFRFSRLWWEVNPANVGIQNTWVGYAKGGELSPYYSDVDLVLNASEDLKQIKAALNHKYPYLNGNLSWVLHPENDYFEPGLTFGQRTAFLRMSVLPANCYFSVAGKAVFGRAQTNLALLQAVNTPSAQFLVYLRRERLSLDPQFQEGDVSRMPWPNLSSLDLNELEQLASDSISVVRRIASYNETDHSFVTVGTRMDSEIHRETASNAISRNETAASKLLSSLLNLSTKDLEFIEKEIIPRWHSRSIANWFELRETPDIISFALGAVFGRWDTRYASGDKPLPELTDAFAALPVCPIGQFQNQVGLPAEPKDVPASYPVDIPWDGILVDDPNHPLDIMGRVRHVIEVIWKDKAADIEHEAAEIQGVKTLRDYFRKSGSGGFWPDHIKRYSKSRRKAPIYWQLATPSASYSVWLYYHRFTRDTFFKVREQVKDKLDHERRKLDRVRTEAGPQPSRSQQKDIEEQERFVAEIATLAEEVERIAPLWNPNLNDGVIINFAPLWRLVPHNKSWQKECRECWESLVKGEYDWSHLAMHLWPERVVPKCVTDASLAIAHGLEDVFWKKDDRDRYQPRPEPDGGWKPVVDHQVRQRTSYEVKAALKSLLEAPVAATGTRTKRPRGKTAN